MTLSYTDPSNNVYSFERTYVPHKFTSVTNEHGYVDYGFWGRGSFQPVCSTCTREKEANTGNGMLCGKCFNAFSDEQILACTEEC